MEGTVKWYNSRKGYGFIKGEDDVDYFIHYSALPEGTFIRENDKVSFDAADTDKGKQAQNVKLLQKGSEIAQEEAPADEESSVESSEDFGEEPAEGASEDTSEEASEEFKEIPEDE